MNKRFSEIEIGGTFYDKYRTLHQKIGETSAKWSHCFTKEFNPDDFVEQTYYLLGYDPFPAPVFGPGFTPEVTIIPPLFPEFARQRALQEELRICTKW